MQFFALFTYLDKAQQEQYFEKIYQAEQEDFFACAITYMDKENARRVCEKERTGR